MTKQFPWDYSPHLTADRLIVIARLIVDGRHTALELHDEIQGDNGWTFGCRAFQFARARILWAVEGGEYPWLTAIDQSLQLIFKIGEVPVRIYRGEADEPSERTLRQTHAELRQLAIIFPEDEVGRDLAYRFAIETDFDGRVSSVKFVGLRGESLILCWDVPFESDVVPMETTKVPVGEGVELPAPAIAVRGADEKRGSDAA